VTRIVFRLLISLSVVATISLAAVPSYARQTDDKKTPPAAEAATAPAPDASPANEDDHERLRPAEPDFSLVNLPTTLPLPQYKSNFHLTHRFNGNLRRNDFGENASNLFGLDQGAAISFEYRFGVTKHLEAIASRSNIGKAIQFSAKYDAVHQEAPSPLGTSSSPVGISALVAIEGENNFRTRYSPSLGAVISRAIDDKAAVYAVPYWARKSGADGGIEHDTFVLGLGARVRVLPTVYVVGEVSPRLGGFAAGDPEFAFGVEKRAGAHVFQLTFANTQATTFGQVAAGGFPQTLYLGFNLARKFF
jgi:hypothetical protein